MSNDKGTAPGSGIPGWRVWKSDRGRFYATREAEFSLDAADAGAGRTVHADDLIALAAAAAEQESIAELVERRALEALEF